MVSAGAYSFLVQLIRRNVLVKIRVVPGITLSAVPQTAQDRKQIIHEGRSFTTGRNERENAYVFCRRGKHILVKMKMNKKKFLDVEYCCNWQQCTAFICIFIANEKWKKGLVALTSFHGSGIMPWLLQDEAFLWRKLEVFARPGVREKGKHWYMAHQFSSPLSPPSHSPFVSLDPSPLIYSHNFGYCMNWSEERTKKINNMYGEMSESVLDLEWEAVCVCVCPSLPAGHSDL